MKILQILPELNAGGVERGTLELAGHLVREGHEALVVSNGGRLVAELEKSGARHVAMAVHRKSLATLFQVRRLRKFLAETRPDIVHLRSRVPAWVAWLAWRGMDPATRPRLVSTVHGFYSVNRYSAVMTRGERVIAVSASIRDYILANYPQTRPDVIRVIPRGIRPGDFGVGFRPDADWLERWKAEQPGLGGREILLLPGRITRLKGHEDFFRLVSALRSEGRPAIGLIAGDTHPKKRA
jgi:glycosyltransferase involved in cell wall biosynthesis